MSVPMPAPHAPAPPRPGRRGSAVVFTVLVSVAMLLGAVVVAMLLVAARAPQAIVLGAVLAAVPVGPVVGCYLWLDRYEPEPRSLLLLGLGWGALVATSAALVLQIFGTVAFHPGNGFTGAVVAPLTEELAKGLFIVLLLWFRRDELDGVLDGIVYAGMVGVGFAFTENILYLSHAYLGGGGARGGYGSAVVLFVVRCVFGPFAHPLFTSFTGIGIGVAASTRNRALRVIAPLAGYVLAVLAHAAWNGSVFYGGAHAFLTAYAVGMVPAFVLMVGFALWVRRREAGVLTRALSDCARRGFLDAAEIPWLASLRLRAVARRHASRVGGTAAARAMKDYQQAAIELAFLHHRVLRGTAPGSYAELGQGFVTRMEQLRPWVVWPSPGEPVRLGGGTR